MIPPRWCGLGGHGHPADRRAFSSHRFDEVYDRLHDDVVWVVPGHDSIQCKEAVVAACTAAAEFAGMASTSFERFVSVGDEAIAVVDAIGRYEDGDSDVSVVSSADVYEFDGGAVVRVTSYAVELSAER